MSSDDADGFDTQRAGRCDACGAALAGMVVVDTNLDERVVCPECCRPGDTGKGVIIKRRLDDIADRWQPGNWRGHMDP